MSAAPESGPFPGLRPFRSDEYHLFFGREEQTAELLALLREHRFLAVVGTSGSGKSSLVRAGLIPALHRGTMTRAGSAWEVVVLRPGGDPVTNLARALIESELYEASDPESLPRLKATLTRSLNGLVEAVRQSEDREPNANLLVVVDQFEEVFRFRSQGLQSARAAGAFVRLLLAASEAAGERLYVAITMRSDYLGDCAQIPGLAEAVNRGEYLIPRLSRDQKRDAIEKPVGVGGGQIAPRLVQRMLNDVGDDPDQLPVLQHALMRSWDHWVAGPRNTPLDLEHYRAVGGMEEALSRHADEVFHALPDDAHRETCRRTFQALTEKGADNRGVRRPARLERLEKIAGGSGISGGSAVAAVVEAFRRPGVTFLMPGTDQELKAATVVDLSHESLMRVWTRLRDWVEEEAQSARIYRRLSETAELWKEGRAGLFRDPDLQIALAWRERAKSNAEWADQYGGGFERAMEFLDRSRDAAGAEARALEAARGRELEQAQALAEAERQRAEERQRALKRSHKLAAVVGLVALIAVIASFIAVSARREALENAALARVSSERAQEKEKAATDLAAQLKANFVESDYQQGIDRLKAGEGPAGLSYLARALRTDPEYRPAMARALGELASGRFSLEGTRTLEQERVITRWNVFRDEGVVYTTDYEGGSGEGSERFVWDLRTGQKLYSGGKWKPGTMFYTTALRHDGWYSLLDPDRKALRFLETRTGTELGSVHFPKQAADLRPYQIPGGAGLVLVKYDDQSLQLWPATGGEPFTPVISRGPAGLLRFGFTPDGQRLLAFYDDQVLTVHDAKGGKQLAEISTAPLGNGYLAPSPRGDFVVVIADNERRADWWPVEGGSAATPASGSARRHLEFSSDVGTWMLPSGDRVSFYWEDPRSRRVSVAVYDLRTRQRTALFESEGPVEGVMYPFDDEGKFRTLRYPLFGFLSETKAQILDLDSGAVLQTMTSATRLGQGRRPDRDFWNEDIVLSPDGRSLATVSVDHGVMLWDPFTGRQLLPKAIEHRGLIWMTFSPDGGKLVTFEVDRRIVQVWDSRDGRRLIEPVLLAGLPGIEFTEGGSRLVLYDQMRTIAGQTASKQTVGKVLVIDLGKRAARPEPLIEPNSHQDGVARYTRDGKRLVVVRETNALLGNGVLVFDAETRRLLRSMDFPPGVKCFGATLVVSADGSRLALGSDDGAVRVFELETGALLQQFALAYQGMSLALSPDGALLAAESEVGKLSVFDLAIGALRFGPLALGPEIDQVQFSPDGKLLAMTTFDARFHLVSTTTGKAVMEPLALKGLPEDFSFSSDGAFIALAPYAPEVQVFDVAARKAVRSLPLTGSCRSAIFSPDGRLLAVGSGANVEDPVGQVTIWDFKEGRRLGKPLDVQGSPLFLQFNEDGSVLATGTVPRTGSKVHVWDVSNGNLLLDPVVGAEKVASVSLRSGGRELAAAWEDGAVRIIDLPPMPPAPPRFPGCSRRLLRCMPQCAEGRVPLHVPVHVSPGSR